MTPTTKMLETWFKEHHPNASADDRVMFWEGVGTSAYLTLPESEQWRKEHGFLNEEDKQ